MLIRKTGVRKEFVQRLRPPRVKLLAVPSSQWQHEDSDARDDYVTVTVASTSPSPRTTLRPLDGPRNEKTVDFLTAGRDDRVWEKVRGAFS
jgi:hypothetical protein